MKSLCFLTHVLFGRCQSACAFVVARFYEFIPCRTDNKIRACDGRHNGGASVFQRRCFTSRPLAFSAARAGESDDADGSRKSSMPSVLCLCCSGCNAQRRLICSCFYQFLTIESEMCGSGQTMKSRLWGKMISTDIMRCQMPWRSLYLCLFNLVAKPRWSKMQSCSLLRQQSPDRLFFSQLVQIRIIVV